MSRSRRGFTLIELSVVIFVLALLAAAIMPSIAAWSTGRKERAFLSDVHGLAVDARETAISSSHSVTLTYDDTGNGAFTLKTTDANGDEQQLRTVQVPDGLTTGKFQAAGKDSNAGDWSVVFYPDGSSDGGGVEINRSTDTYSLTIQKSNGIAQLITGSIPDTSQDSWSAGDYVHRTQ